MTENTNLPDDLAALVGQVIHVIDPAGLNMLLEPGSETGWAYPVSRLYPRGSEVVLTEDILRASIDRKGRSWLLNSDLSAEPRWAFGPWPQDEQVLVKGSPDAIFLADQQKALAWRTLAGPELARALRDIDARLGRGGNHSVTLRSDAREARRQQEDAEAQRRLAQAELQRQAVGNTSAAQAIEYGGGAA